jgi:hypothetical protein
MRVSARQPASTSPRAHRTPPLQIHAQGREIAFDAPVKEGGKLRTCPKQIIGNVVYACVNSSCSISGNGLGYVQIPLEVLGIASGNSVLVSPNMASGCVRNDLGNSAGPDPAKSALRVGAGEELTRGHFEKHGQAVRRIQPRPVPLLPAWTVMDSRDAPAPSRIGAIDWSMKPTQVASNYATTTLVSQQGDDQRVPRVYTPPEYVELNTAAETVGKAKAYFKYSERSQMHGRGQQRAAEAKYNKSSQNRAPERQEQILIGSVGALASVPPKLNSSAAEFIPALNLATEMTTSGDVSVNVANEDVIIAWQSSDIKPDGYRVTAGMNTNWTLSGGRNNSGSKYNLSGKNKPGGKANHNEGDNAFFHRLETSAVGNVSVNIAGGDVTTAQQSSDVMPDGYAGAAGINTNLTLSDGGNNFNSSCSLRGKNGGGSKANHNGSENAKLHRVGASAIGDVSVNTVSRDVITAQPSRDARLEGYGGAAGINANFTSSGGSNNYGRNCSLSGQNKGGSKANYNEGDNAFFHCVGASAVGDE